MIPIRNHVIQWTVEQVAAHFQQVQLNECSEFVLDKGINGQKLLNLKEEDLIRWYGINIATRRKVYKLISEINSNSPTKKLNVPRGPSKAPSDLFHNRGLNSGRNFSPSRSPEDQSEDSYFSESDSDEEPLKDSIQRKLSGSSIPFKTPQTNPVAVHNPPVPCKPTWLKKKDKVEVTEKPLPPTPPIPNLAGGYTLRPIPDLQCHLEDQDGYLQASELDYLQPNEINMPTKQQADDCNNVYEPVEPPPNVGTIRSLAQMIPSGPPPDLPPRNILSPTRSTSPTPQFRPTKPAPSPHKFHRPSITSEDVLEASPPPVDRRSPIHMEIASHLTKNPPDIPVSSPSPLQSVPLPPTPTSLGDSVTLSNGEKVSISPLYRTLLTEDYFFMASRQDAVTLLKGVGTDGAFLLRPSSTSHPLTLSLFYRGDVKNISVRQRKQDGCFALGKEKEHEKIFNSVDSLVRHFRSNYVELKSGGEVKLTAPPVCDNEHLYIKVPILRGGMDLLQ